jgi:tetratricopeptide (TPR) repeat protein
MNFVEKVKILQNYFKAGNFKKVIEGCETLNKKFPENSFVLNLLGMAYQELQKNYKAIDYFELALKADQSNIAAMNNLANSLKNTGEFEKADEIFKKILRIDPNYINVYNNYANLKSTVNDVEGAILLYKKGLLLAKEKNVNPINFLFHLASSFQSLNKKKELMEIINEIFKIDPDDINANKTLSSIYKYSKENHEAMTHLAKMKNISKKIDLSDNQKKTIFFFIR